jgi:hypothetical protein
LTLAELMDLCRAKRVRSIGGIQLQHEGMSVAPSVSVCIKFFEDVPEGKPTPEDKDATETCRCGCPLVGHVNGLCTTGGCDPEKCAPEVR